MGHEISVNPAFVGCKLGGADYVFRVSGADSTLDLHNQCGRSLPSYGAEIHQSESHFPNRRFHPQGHIPVREGNLEKVDDAGTGVGVCLQPDYDFLRRQIRGIAIGALPRTPRFLRFGLSGAMQNGRHFCPPFHRLSPRQAWGRSSALPRLHRKLIIGMFLVDYSIYTEKRSEPCS